MHVIMKKDMENTYFGTCIRVRKIKAKTSLNYLNC